MSTEHRDSGRPEKPRKPYRPPRVVEYGDIRAVTRTLSPQGKNDGGGGKTKTA